MIAIDYKCTYPIRLDSANNRENVDNNANEKNASNLKSECSNTADAANVKDRILLAQQQILSASKELEIILNEKFTETIDVIQNVRRSMLDAQQIHLAMLSKSQLESNRNEKEFVYQRPVNSDTQKRRLNNSNGQQRSEPNRLIKFRRSLRRQLSSKSLRTGTGSGQEFDPNTLASGGSKANKLSEVDYCSRYLFPFSFVTFAISYWIVLIYYKLN